MSQNKVHKYFYKNTFNKAKFKTSHFQPKVTRHAKIQENMTKMKRKIMLELAKTSKHLQIQLTAEQCTVKNMHITLTPQKLN